MNSIRHLLLPVCRGDPLRDLATLAGGLLSEPGGQIDLMGVVVVPEGHALSEAAVPAQETRETLMGVARSLPDLPLHVKPRVRVGRAPLQEIFAELLDEPVDLLLLPVHKAGCTTLGASLEEVLTHAPCDLILARGVAHHYDRALVPIRGGPHLTLTLRLARALHRVTGQPVTLLNVSSADTPPAALEYLRQQLDFEFEIVSQKGEPREVIRRMSTDYHLLVLGSTLQKRVQATRLGRVPAEILKQSTLPTFLVSSFHPAGKEIPKQPGPVAEVNKVSNVSDRVERWFATNTFHWSEFECLDQLVSSKQQQGNTISLVLPTLNEEATIGTIIATMRKALMLDYPLLDEIIVMDSNSTDHTREIAASLGVPVFIHQQVLTESVGSCSGKGEALWKSLYVARGDIIAWIDTDIVNVHPRFVSGILGPLLRWPRIQYVKGFYRRPLRIGDKTQLSGGGRVTELVARPFINLFFPELSGIVQPLSGEYAGRRQALEKLPFFTGYGVESGLLLDLLAQLGLQSIAQCDLEMRTQDSQSLGDLSKMAFAILQVFMSRLEKRCQTTLLEDSQRTMKIICQEPGRFCLDEAAVAEHERPPMATVAAYQDKFAIGRANTSAVARS